MSSFEIPPLSADDVDVFARVLDDAAAHAAPIGKLSDQKPFHLQDAYAIQRAGIALRKLRADDVVGKKMGFTSHAKMQQMGVHEPIYGQLTRTMILPEGAAFNRKDHCHPRVEPEIVFVLGKDLEGPTTAAHALSAVDAVCAGLEIIDSRYLNFQFTLPDVVADNASASRFVLGSLLRPRDFSFGNCGIVLEKNGVVVECGSSAAVLDHPLRSLVALASLLVPHGDKLRAGDIVLSGGAVAAVAAAAGDHVRARFDGLGCVDVFCV